MNEENLVHFARSEFKTAVVDFAKTTPQDSLLRFYRRLDAATEVAIQAAGQKPACRQGCAYCCYYKVEARALEILVIHQFVVRHFSQEQLRQVIEQATCNVVEAKNLSYVEQLAINQRCPFLIEDKCSIYPVRPTKCRNFHAADFDGCKASYDEPTNLDIPNSYIPEVFEVGNGMAAGFQGASDQAGLDSRVYDLNSAFLEAVANPKAAKRFKSRKKTFTSAKVVEVPDGETV